MKNKIKEIHNKLSSSKIDSFDSTISTSSFSSVLSDRFVSELKKMKINWDLNPTTINKLANNKTTNSSANKSEIIIPETKSNKNIDVGIDIQLISSLPVVKDPWEDQFYKDNFKKNEIAHCLKKKNIFQSFAGIFALKEAIYKIDGTEKNDITIKFSKDGKPVSSKYSISISHDHEYAIGIALLNQEKNYLIEIERLNNKIDKNHDFITKLETELSLKPKNKNYILYFLIITIISYLLYKDFLFYFFQNILFQ
tara:strand:+ start:40 stop:798 length:759 start_codon:yes stop_codon:yes gene_type:complete